MATPRRCSECRGTFTPSPRARATQRVCGAACRVSRDRRLARARRRRELAEHRSDERQRQQLHREKQRGASAAASPAPSAAERHAPASPPNPAISPRKLAEIVDRAFELSRASLLRDLRQLAGKAAQELAIVAPVTRQLESPPASFS
jgi:hypothetical protein